jgi:PAS domain S-box-containing protein
MKSTAGPLVLNVDDNVSNLHAKSHVLRGAGFDVCEATSGRDALRMVAERRPALVLLDVRLPDISGLDVCRRIKSSPATQRIPVLHVTASYTADDAQVISAQSGADIFLVEPISPEELVTVVRTLLRLRTSEAGLAESEARLRLATEAAEIATWEMDLRSGAAQWSAHFRALLGVRPDAAADWSLWRARVHRDDLARVTETLDRVRRERTPLQCEYRISTAGLAEQRWIAMSGSVFLDGHAEATRLVGIAMDVTARKVIELRREQLLRREHALRAQAEEAVRVKDQFLATLSHELRTPLNAIVGWLQLLRTGRLDANEQRRALETIERNARLQTQLINDMLDVSRIVTGQLRLETAPMHPAAALAAAIESVRPSAREKEIAIVAKLPDADLVVRADPGRLQQVFTNLLGNAIKFSPAGSKISVTAQRTDDSLRVAIADQGEGIPKELLPRLFERFWQADGSITRRHGGLGLGLAIVRHLLDLHGGSIEVESAGRGRGATFTVVLPMTNALQRASPPQSEPAPAGSASSLRGLQALIVDDHTESATMLAEMLDRAGMHVRTARDAKQALAAFKQGAADVLISDIGMPGHDGYDLIRALRREFPDRMRACVAIALSGYARNEDRAAALAASYDLHVSKPFDMRRLVASIAELVARKMGSG